MTGAGGRTGITTKIEAPRGRGPGTRRAGERLTNGGTKTTGKGTGKRGRPKGRAGVEAETGGTKAGQKKRAGKEIGATAERGIESETESSVLTNVVVAKRGATISESPATTTVNTANAEGVTALSKMSPRSNIASSTPVFFFLFSTQSVTCAKEKEC